MTVLLLLLNLMIETKTKKIDPKSHDVLLLLATGTILVTSIVFPGIAMAAGQIVKMQKRAQWEKSKREWEKFNSYRLRQIIKRMQQQKYIEIVEIDNVPIIRILEKGKKRLLRYDIEQIKLDETFWDRKWRLIIYDVKSMKRAQSEMFRRALLKLKLLKIQNSVYLTPFRCENEIEYLRQLFDIGKEVQIVTVRRLENEPVYRKYFDI